MHRFTTKVKYVQLRVYLVTSTRISHLQCTVLGSDNTKYWYQQFNKHGQGGDGNEDFILASTVAGTVLGNVLSDRGAGICQLPFPRAVSAHRALLTICVLPFLRAMRYREVNLARHEVHFHAQYCAFTAKQV